MSEYVTPPRCPDELLAADLPDWAVMVWLAVRMKQGSNSSAWHDYATYGAACGKSYAMVRKAVAVLVKSGWLERTERLPGGRGYRLRCLWNRSDTAPKEAPTQREQDSRSQQTQREQGSQPSGNGVPPQREQGSHSPTPPYKEESVKESVKESKRAREAPAPDDLPDLPDWIDAETWSDWTRYRSESKKPLKPTTIEYQLKQLTKFRDHGHDPNEIIRTSIANTWTGLFEPKPGKGKRRSNARDHDPSAAHDRIGQILDASLPG